VYHSRHKAERKYQVLVMIPVKMQEFSECIDMLFSQMTIVVQVWP
jgi:hypothetical protein